MTTQDTPYYNSEKPFRILSIQGGGIRGIIPSLILLKLEQITGKHISELFDLFIGSSTGAMICAILNLKETKEGEPKYKAKDLLEVYVKEAPRTFETSTWKKLSTISGLYGPLYYTQTRDDRFKAWLGETKLADTLKHVIITAYDMCTQSPVFFKTRKAKENVDENIPLIDCIKASTAAPTIFPPHAMSNSVYIDALYGKNPALFGVTEAIKQYGCSLDNIYLLSLGTGYLTKLQEPHKVSTSGPGFLVDVFNSIVNANTTSATYMLRTFLTGKSQILDLDISLPEEHMGICDSSKENINYLIKSTEDFITMHENELVEFAKLLLE